MIWFRRACIAAAVLVLGTVLLDRLFPPPLERAESVSKLVLDRDGQPLRAFPVEEGRWRLAADLDQIDPLFLDAVVAVEDKRFWRHGGVDWVGLGRAAVTSAMAGEIVSGGSTITMQTARLLEPRPRTIPSKLIEMLRAHQIESRLTKREILELYLTLTPYGGNLEGVRSASWRYFGRAPDRLTDDQIALLIALPQAPEARRPDLRPAAAIAGRNAIADRLERLGVLSGTRAEDIRLADLHVQRRAFPAKAWHASEVIAGQGQGDVVSTLDGRLQAGLEKLLNRMSATLPSDVQLSAIIVESRSREVRAMVGAVDRSRPGGWIDLTAQPRSPGSTLKPFIYAMAFDGGLAKPSSRIADLPSRFAAYQPENFDRTFRGDVRISDALQHSLNVPAVIMLDLIGPARFAATLSEAGALPRVPEAAERRSGLALALGGAGMTMRELAVLYSALGDDGVARPLVWRAEQDETGPVARLVSAESAKKIVDILKASPTPEGRMPGRLTESAPAVAFKTGTSYGFRDAWAAGIAGEHVILVWIGRADGAPRPGETGRKAALPVLFEIADLVQRTLGASEPSQTRIASRKASRVTGALAQADGTYTRPEILFPPENAELWAGPVNGAPARAFAFSGRGAGELSWFADGEPVRTDAAGLPVWRPARNGFYRVTAVDQEGRSAESQIRVIGLETPS